MHGVYYSSYYLIMRTETQQSTEAKHSKDSPLDAQLNCGTLDGGQVVDCVRN